MPQQMKESYLPYVDMWIKETQIPRKINKLFC